MGGLSALLLLLVPVGRYIITYPPAVELLATCDGAVLHLQDVSQYSCHPLPPYAHETNMRLVLNLLYLYDLHLCYFSLFLFLYNCYISLLLILRVSNLISDLQVTFMWISL